MSRFHRTSLFVMMSLFAITVFSTSAFAQVPIPPQMFAYMTQNITGLLVSENQTVLFQDDQTQFYYAHDNPFGRDVDLVYSINCTGYCSNSLTFDTFWEDTLPASKKKAAALFIQTNNTPLGEYTFKFIVSDNQTGALIYSVPMKVKVISRSLWKQFWHDFADAIIFWD